MEVLNLTAPLFGIVLIGYLCARFKSIPPEGLEWMQFYIVYVALPAMFFQIIRKTPVAELLNWRFVVVTTGITACMFFLCFIVGRYVFKANWAEATMQGIAGAYSNIGYMGPALSLSAIGPAAAVPTALIVCFDNALLFTLCPLFMAIGSKKGLNFSTFIGQVIVKKILLHPFIASSIVGGIFALFALPLPAPADAMLTALQQTAAPTALFVLGVVVAGQKAQWGHADVGLILMVKLLLHPFLVWLALPLVGVTDPVWLYTAVLLAALPQALNVFVLAQQYQVYVVRSSTIILIGTALSAITVTILLYWVRQVL